MLAFAEFYGLMPPPDNLATIAAGAAVEFSQNGPNNGIGSIYKINNSSFMLVYIGVYEVHFQVSVFEAGQLVLTLNDSELLYTVVGRATGTTQIVGMCLIQTNTTNSVLTVSNPSENSTALTIAPNAGGTKPVSCHLVIKQLL